MLVSPVRQDHDDREDQRRCTDDGSADQHGLGGGLEGVAGPVVFLQQELGVFEIGLDAIDAPEFFASRPAAASMSDNS